MAWKYILNEGESTCCGASVYENTDICSACKEHCEVVNLEEQTEEEWEAECEHQQNVDLGIHDDYLDRCN
tara:strand:- start:8563 stop:8772 length:210 start_codon:yes stop_codon:yes gene_type:complete